MDGGAGRLAEGEVLPEHERTRWQRVEAIVDAALDLPAEERSAFVRSECANDAELFAAVAAWLAACADPALFPDSTALEYGAALLTGEDSSPHAEIPARIGAYRIIRELGHGGMGTVFQAERADGQFAQRVALKLMRRGTSTDDHLRRRFLEERQILARLEHPNIATLLDGGITDEGQPFFVMRYIDGAPLDRYCDEQQLSIEARLRVFLIACAAVQHAHRHQVVHRDLKPGNIIIGPDGQVVLLDFGIAKLMEEADQGTPITRTAERLLTPEFASPEQIRGEAVRPASDVYALGVLLYIVLTGAGPYRQNAHTPHELERAVLDNDPTSPSTAIRSGVKEEAATASRRGTTPERLRRRLRGDLDAIVLTCLQKDPARRYADAGQLAEDIRRHLEGRAVSVRGKALGYRLHAIARRHRAAVTGIAAGLLVGSVLIAGWFGGYTPRARTGGIPVLALGRINDYRANRDAEEAAPLADMLATNLARTEGLAVVSPGRMRELLGTVGVSEQDYARAAIRAGATEIVTGAVYSAESGTVRLDLRRMNIATGNIAAGHSAVGPDLFALADQATAELVTGLGLNAPPGSVADVTTHSLTAYRQYTQGLAFYYSGERQAAAAAFAAALRADSTFAMAAFYDARSAGYQWRFLSATSEERAQFAARIGRALRLAESASDRERLLIRAWAAGFHLAPEFTAVAETLAVRYPHETDGHLMLGVSLELQGDLPAALTHFNRLIELDSSGLRAGGERCTACSALDPMIETYVLMDSLESAMRQARLWLARQPESPGAHEILAQLLDGQGRHAEALVVLTERHNNGAVDSIIALAKHWIRSGELVNLDTTLQTWSARLSGPARAALLFYRALGLRHQGRLQSALAAARQLRIASAEPREVGAAPPSALVEAQTLLELGRFHEAVALFDSISRWPARGQPPSVRSTLHVQSLSMLAAALSSAGDTTRLESLADSLERVGGRALFFRPRVQHQYVRGLLLAARGADLLASAALERALQPVAVDFGRANLELAQLYLRNGRARDAVRVLQLSVRGWFLETTNLHMTLTEAHELLARAWELAAVPDSAVLHWKRVARAWEGADAQFNARRQHAVARARALERS